jgi:hypothetical protein
LFASCVGVCWCVFVGEGGRVEIGLHQQALPNIQLFRQCGGGGGGGGGGELEAAAARRCAAGLRHWRSRDCTDRRWLISR